MAEINWNYIFSRQPENGQYRGRLGGLDPVYKATSYRLLDDFEASSYANNGALQAVWTTDGGATLPTLGTGIYGDVSLQIIGDAATAAISRTFANARYGFAHPGQLEYPGSIIGVRFRATTSVAAGETIQVRLRDDTDATLFRSWNVAIGTATTQIYEVDFRRTADANGASAWDEVLVDEFGFAGLDNGTTYRFDHIEFVSAESIPDALYQIKADIDSLLTETHLYSKSSPAQAELDDELNWFMELYDPGDDIITVAEITPGNYQIDRLRNGVTTNIVPLAAASEAAGRIFATYTPTSANWALGDLILVTFSGGSVAIASATGTTTTVLPTAFFYTRLSREEDIYTVTGTTGQITTPTDPTWDDVNKWWEGNLLQFVQKLTMYLGSGDGAGNTEIVEDHSLPGMVGLGTDAAAAPGTDNSVHAILRGVANALGVTAAGGGQYEIDGIYDLWDTIVTGYDSTAIAPNINGAVIELLKLIIAAVAGTTGTADAGSTDAQIVDAVRTEADNYWAGARIIMATGANAGLGRVLETWTLVGTVGVFVNAFPNAIVAGDVYIIVPEYHGIPPANDAGNVTIEQAIGSKADTAVQTSSATASILAYAKGLITAIGNPTADTLTSLTAKWGNLNQSFATWAGSFSAHALTSMAAKLGDSAESLTTILGLTSTVADQTSGASSVQARLRGILTSLGDPSAHALTTFVAKFGDSAQSLLTVLGLTTDAAVQTAANASLQAGNKGIRTSLGDPSGQTLTSVTAKFGNNSLALSTILQPTFTDGSVGPSDFNAAPVTILSLSPANNAMLSGFYIDCNGFTNGAILTFTVLIRTGAGNLQRQYQTTFTKDANNTLYVAVDSEVPLKNVATTYVLNCQSNNAGDAAVTAPFSYLLRSFS